MHHWNREQIFERWLRSYLRDSNKGANTSIRCANCAPDVLNYAYQNQFFKTERRRKSN
jgi:hypothetical protein